jgi:hypothetical protein
MRERFPNIAFYEKKQNAIKVKTRSLATIFFFNFFVCLFFWLIYVLHYKEYVVGWLYFWWAIGQLAIAWVFFRRFKLEKEYYAQYIFESFLATRPLLKSSKN